MLANELKALVEKAIVARSVLTKPEIALSNDLSKLDPKASTTFLLTCELNLGTNKAFCSAILFNNLLCTGRFCLFKIFEKASLLKDLSNLLGASTSVLFKYLSYSLLIRIFTSLIASLYWLSSSRAYKSFWISFIDFATAFIPAFCVWAKVNGKDKLIVFGVLLYLTPCLLSIISNLAIIQLPICLVDYFDNP